MYPYVPNWLACLPRQLFFQVLSPAVQGHLWRKVHRGFARGRCASYQQKLWRPWDQGHQGCLSKWVHWPMARTGHYQRHLTWCNRSLYRRYGHCSVQGLTVTQKVYLMFKVSSCIIYLLGLADQMLVAWLAPATSARLGPVSTWIGDHYLLTAWVTPHTYLWTGMQNSGSSAESA